MNLTPFSARGSPITQEMGRQLLATGMYAPLAWMALAICWLGVLISYLASRKRKRLLATQTGLESLRAGPLARPAWPASARSRSR
jgi:restriction system protein